MIVHIKISLLIMVNTAQPLKTVVFDDIIMSSVAPEELWKPHNSLSLSFKIIKPKFNGYSAILSVNSTVF